MLMIHEPVISIRDKGRLMEVLDRACRSWSTYAPCLESFRSRLRQFEVVPPADVPDDVITMNSRFVVNDLRGGGEKTYTLVYPDEESLEQGRLCVLSLAGMAFFGARVGDVVRWNGVTGPRCERVESLVYQPEAEGHLHL